jgi:predicted nuclease of predicted toxin-antitoxin system
MHAGWFIYDFTEKIFLVKLLANENFPISSVRWLREIGYDITAVGTDHPGISDEYVITLANNEERTILTFDKDYGELIYKHNYKPGKGVIFLRLSMYEPEDPGILIHKLFSDYQIKVERSLTVFDGVMVRQRNY